MNVKYAILLLALLCTASVLQASNYGKYLASLYSKTSKSKELKDITYRPHAEAATTLAIYGNYCGPKYCSGENTYSNACSYSLQPKDELDACCLVHDRCCGIVNDFDSCVANRCDTALVECTKKQQGFMAVTVTQFFEHYGGCCGYFPRRNRDGDNRE